MSRSNNQDNQPWEPPMAADDRADVVDAIAANFWGRLDFAISVDIRREPLSQLVLRPAINRLGVPFLYDPSGRDKTDLQRCIQHGIRRDLGFCPSDLSMRLYD